MSRTGSSAGRLILLSVWAGLFWAVLAIGWGLAVRSQMIVFDGLYSLISVLLSLLSLLSFRIIRKGQSKRFPFGRDALEPLTIIVKAIAIGTLCVYALSVAVMELLTGGREVNTGWAVAYAAVATGGCAVVAAYLGREQRAVRSDLVRAETTQWLMDTVLSAGVLAGFIAAAVLERTGYERLAAYVDPAMVALVCLLFLAMPLRLLVHGFREVLFMAPPRELGERVRRCIRQVQRRHGFDDSYLRSTKVDGQLVVEVDYIVGEHTPDRSVEVLDAIRREITDELSDLDYELWLTVSFTTDRAWAE
ncbi:Predicted Co/Zn/Cd cation transporter, cation efflux family [Haloechinothrix alba]|uniref:Predicted Co/Zn/Cd cation transporter, cation efflux family n=1 Tax=Haloechinothrix alba TaxID=664784 RepID=A0A238X6D8_9PSEU|nr:cation transporter [Haloechinothrix alba]SNR54596.1 Predicted Co/Zn/Cd cation transporter, cation efflux family [Haloechinothrix alba]